MKQGQEITDEKAVLYYAAIHGLVDKANCVLIGCILLGTGLIIVALILTSIVSLVALCAMSMKMLKFSFSPLSKQNIIRNNNDKFIVKDKKKSDINHNLKYHKAATMPLDEKVKMTSAEK